MRENVIAACLLTISISGSVLFARAHATEMHYKVQALNDTLPANNDITRQMPDGNTKVFDKVDVEANFPGGIEGWKGFLMANLNPSVPIDKGAPAGTYTVIVQFIVDTDGSISDIKALTHYGYGMEGEVLRTLRKSPTWEPAMQNGRAVKAYRKQPITFSVQEEKRSGDCFK